MRSSLWTDANSPHPRKRTGGASNLIGDGLAQASLSKHPVDGGATDPERFGDLRCP
jgi:hypothetical protein